MTTADVLEGMVVDQSIVQIVLFFGHNQEVTSDTRFTFYAECMVLTHASRGQTLIRYDTIAFINTVPKGQEPTSWRRERTK